jgi:hypothetical protein
VSDIRVIDVTGSAINVILGAELASAERRVESGCAQVMRLCVAELYTVTGGCYMLVAVVLASRTPGVGLASALPRSDW